MEQLNKNIVLICKEDYADYHTMMNRAPVQLLYKPRKTRSRKWLCYSDNGRIKNIYTGQGKVS